MQAFQAAQNRAPSGCGSPLKKTLSVSPGPTAGLPGGKALGDLAYHVPPSPAATHPNGKTLHTRKPDGPALTSKAVAVGSTAGNVLDGIWQRPRDKRAQKGKMWPQARRGVWTLLLPGLPGCFHPSRRKLGQGRKSRNSGSKSARSNLGLATRSQVAWGRLRHLSEPLSRRA